MTTEGVDYAWSRPDPAGLYAAGKRFASRYLSYDNTGKNLTLAEAERLAAAGIAVVANWEWAAGDAKGGFAAGQRYAAEAVRQAAACGMPAGRPIYFSVDYDPAGSYGPIDDYFRGIGSVLPVGQIGAYGGYATIDHLLGAGLIRWAWQTYAWSGGRWHPGAHVRQYRNGVIVAGGDVDLDLAMVADYGQWMSGEGDMPTPEEYAAAVLNAPLDVYELDESGVAQKVGETTLAASLAFANCAAWSASNALLVSSPDRKPKPPLRALPVTGGGSGGPVDLTPAAVAAVADATADELAADPERDGAGT